MLSKILTTESSVLISDFAVKVRGGTGYLRSCAATQMLRDSRAAHLYEGSTGVFASQFVLSMKTPKGQESTKALGNYLQREDLQMSYSLESMSDLGELWKACCNVVESAHDPATTADSFSRIACLLGFATSWSRIESVLHPALVYDRIRAASAFFGEQILPEVYFRQA